MKFRVLMLALILSAVLRNNGYAYESFAATCFEERTQRIDGKIRQLVYGNTHSFLHVETPDEGGLMQTWAVECGPKDQLKRDRAGEYLKSDDHVIVTGNPGRNADNHRLRMQSITRSADGWKWSGVAQ
jgi:Family of unknown function (DUF6152)